MTDSQISPHKAQTTNHSLYTIHKTKGFISRDDIIIVKGRQHSQEGHHQNRRVSEQKSQKITSRPDLGTMQSKHTFTTDCVFGIFYRASQMEPQVLFHPARSEQGYEPIFQGLVVNGEGFYLFFEKGCFLFVLKKSVDIGETGGSFRTAFHCGRAHLHTDMHYMSNYSQNHQD